MWPETTELGCTAEQMLEQAEEVPEKPIRWEGDHLEFMKLCVALAQIWKGRVHPGDPLPRDFGNFEERSQFAVNIAIGSMTLHDNSQMAVAWINHRYGHFCAALRVATLTTRAFSPNAAGGFCVALQLRRRAKLTDPCARPETPAFASA